MLYARVKEPLRIGETSRNQRFSKPKQVVEICNHKPVDGPETNNTVVKFNDGSWEFIWNVSFIPRLPQKKPEPEYEFVVGLFKSSKMIIQIGKSITCTHTTASFIASILEAIAHTILKDGCYIAYDYKSDVEWANNTNIYFGKI